jgi:putative solute:sodium symporter small subunit
MADNKRAKEYWRKNTRLIAILLFVWAFVSYGCGILFANALRGVHVGKLDAGFWFAQQGSIYVFVALIFIYAWRMERLDREHDVHEEEK